MSSVVIGFVGDVLVNRDAPSEAFRDVRDILKAPQIMFANVEGAYTDNPHPSPGAYAMVGAPVHNLDVYADVGFNVVSLANNHVLDMGYEAMLDTRARLRDQGVKTCGVGDCLADAREPAIVEAGGLRVAFLAYAATFPVGYEARSNAPGLAPMRAYNVWRDPFPHSPGCAPIVTTTPDPTDLANLAEDISRTRNRADLVVTSFHWGDYSRPFHLTDHELRTARYCIDHGADIVVGHNHHALRGMEWYRGKPIMYGLGHFVFDLRLELSQEVKEQLQAFDDDDERPSYRVAPREGWPLLPLHPDTRMTVIAWASVTRDGVTDIGFLPCRLTPDGLVYPLKLGSSECDDVVAYLDKAIRSQRLKGAIVADGAVPLTNFSTLRVIPT